MNEAPRNRAERKVGTARSHGVGAIDRDVVKAIISLRVGDRQTILCAGHPDGHAFNGISIRVEDPASDIAGLGRGQITSQGKIALARIIIDS